MSDTEQRQPPAAPAPAMCEKFMRMQHDLTLALASAQSLAAAYDIILQTCLQVEDVDCGLIYEISPDDGDARVMASVGLSEAFLACVRHYSADSPNVHMTMLGQPAYFQTKGQAILPRAVWEEEGLRVAATLPVKSGERVVGTLNLGSHTRDDFGERTRMVLETLANHVGEIIIRFQAEKAVRESEKRHREIFDSAPTPIWEDDFSAVADYLRQLRDEGITDLAAYFTERPMEVAGLLARVRVRNVNQAAVDFYRASSREELVRRLPEVYTPNSYAALAPLAPRLLEGFSVIQAEIPTRTLDGEPREILLRFAVVPGHEKKLDRVVISSVDLTERKRAERALRESTRKLNTLVGNLPGVIVRCRNAPGWPVEYIGGCVERLTGYPESEFSGRSSREYLAIVFEQDRDKLTAAIREAIATRRPYSVEYRITTKDGEARWIGEKGAAVCENNEVVAIESFLFDITERKKADRERNELQVQLTQAQKMDSIGRLAGGVAHDFNNLLTVINGYCQLAARRVGEDAALSELIDEINRAGERASSLTRQLLNFSRKQIIDPKPLDLNETIRDMRGMLRRLVGEDVEFVMRLQEDLGRTLADAGQIQQVLMNLVVNARDAMPQGGRLTVSTKRVDIGAAEAARRPEIRVGEFVCLTVSDTGAGMDEDVRRRIFEPFFTTKKGLSAGLGLATVYGAVDRCGGWILVESSPGNGSSFHVHLPCAHGHVPVVAAEPVQVSRHGDETVLVAEDQIEVRTLVSAALRAYGYRVLEAASGNEALEVYAEHKGLVDLLLSDVVMPGMPGTELARQLLEQKQNLKVLYMSGYSDDLVARRGVLDPGVAYLPKPFTPDTLAAKVREVLG